MECVSNPRTTLSWHGTWRKVLLVCVAHSSLLLLSCSLVWQAKHKQRVFVCAEHGITPAVIELCREFNRPSFQDVSLARERDSTRRTPPTATAASHNKPQVGQFSNWQQQGVTCQCFRMKSLMYAHQFRTIYSRIIKTRNLNACVRTYSGHVWVNDIFHLCYFSHHVLGRLYMHQTY